MKKQILVFIFSVFCAMSYAQVGSIFFSSAGGSNPNVPASLGEPFSSSGGLMSVGSRKNTDLSGTVGVLPTQETKDRVLLFPNPSTGEFNIQIIGKNESDFTVRAFDLVGKELLVSTKNNQLSKVSLATYSPGVYQIAVYSKEGQLLFNQSVIKQ